MPQRMIFGGQVYTDDEKASISHLKAHLEKNSVSYERYDFSIVRWDDELMLRHLQGNDFKIDESYKSLAFAQ